MEYGLLRKFCDNPKFDIDMILQMNNCSQANWQ